MVYVMSTNSAPTSTTVKCRAKDRSVSKISCPENVHSHNRFMGRVDLADQLRGYYHVRLKCRKFYKFCLSLAPLWKHIRKCVPVQLLYSECIHSPEVLQTQDYFRKPLMVQLNFATCPKPKSLKVSGVQDCCRSRHNKGGAPCSEDPLLTSLQQRR